MITLLFMALIYGIIEMFKIFLNDTRLQFFTPLFSCILGAILAIVCLVFKVELLPVTTFIDSLFYGLICGLAASGWHCFLQNFAKHKKSAKNAKKAKKSAKDKNKIVSFKKMSFDKNNVQTQPTPPQIDEV